MSRSKNPREKTTKKTITYTILTIKHEEPYSDIIEDFFELEEEDYERMMNNRFEREKPK